MTQGDIKAGAAIEFTNAILYASWPTPVSVKMLKVTKTERVDGNGGDDNANFKAALLRNYRLHELRKRLFTATYLVVVSD